MENRNFSVTDSRTASRILKAWSVTTNGFQDDSIWNRLPSSAQSEVAQHVGDLLYSMGGQNGKTNRPCRFSGVELHD